MDYSFFFTHEGKHYEIDAVLDCHYDYERQTMWSPGYEEFAVISCDFDKVKYYSDAAGREYTITAKKALDAFWAKYKKLIMDLLDNEVTPDDYIESHF
jgi:hypothetical protein